MNATTLRVDLGDRGYDVVIDQSFDALTAATRDFRRAAVVTQSAVAAHVSVDDALGALPHDTYVMDEGEDAKSLATVNELCRKFAAGGLLRGDVVIAVGGGVVGDTAGFAAASYHRGVAVVQVPTTLLAMVDSAIGGKTGVNLPEGKNLVGAFHQPRAVCINPTVLTTLPNREFRCGLGEIAKYALIDDLKIDDAALLAREPDVLADTIAACVGIKARFVEADEFERTGARATLNYGHTLGHALEVTTGHALLHGEAVAIGLVFAGQLAGALERIDPKAVARHEAVVRALGLPTVAPAGLPAEGVLRVMARDKKSAGGLTFVLAGPSGIEKVDNVEPAAVHKALAAVGIEN